MEELVRLLKENSERLNLFSRGDREKIQSKHLPDSLAITEFWPFEDGARVMDIGTGGGLPGLAMAQHAKDEGLELSFTLVDARQKKISAVQSMAHKLELENVECISARFEELAHDKKRREQYDAVTARAVAPLPVLLEYAVGFLKVGGSLWAWKGPSYEEELETAREAMEVLNIDLETLHRYVLPDGDERYILQFTKFEELDDKYPRENGRIKKKPL